MVKKEPRHGTKHESHVRTAEKEPKGGPGHLVVKTRYEGTADRGDRAPWEPTQAGNLSGGANVWPVMKKKRLNPKQPKSKITGLYMFNQKQKSKKKKKKGREGLQSRGCKHPRKKNQKPGTRRYGVGPWGKPQCKKPS